MTQGGLAVRHRGWPPFRRWTWSARTQRRPPWGGTALPPGNLGAWDWDLHRADQVYVIRRAQEASVRGRPPPLPRR
jgi:hypothetical protein